MAGGGKDRTGKRVRDGKKCGFLRGAHILFGRGTGSVKGINSNLDGAKMRCLGAAAAIINPVGGRWGAGLYL